MFRSKKEEFIKGKAICGVSNKWTFDKSSWRVNLFYNHYNQGWGIKKNAIQGFSLLDSMMQRTAENYYDKIYLTAKIVNYCHYNAFTNFSLKLRNIYKRQKFNLGWNLVQWLHICQLTTWIQYNVS